MSRRNLCLSGILAAFVFLSSASSVLAQATDWKQIHPPPLHAFVPQPPVRIQLTNGMVILLEEDHELPFINATARIRGGSLEEPANKIGLVSLFGQVWRTGGTHSKTGDQMDDYLESRPAKIETSGGASSTNIRLNCLKENWDDVFKLFVELLREPEFREAKLSLAKNQSNTGISRRNDDSFQIAFRESAKLVYGLDSPYARSPEYATISAINRLIADSSSRRSTRVLRVSNCSSIVICIPFAIVRYRWRCSCS